MGVVFVLQDANSFGGGWQEWQYTMNVFINNIDG